MGGGKICSERGSGMGKIGQGQCQCAQHAAVLQLHLGVTHAMIQISYLNRSWGGGGGRGGEEDEDMTVKSAAPDVQAAHVTNQPRRICQGDGSGGQAGIMSRPFLHFMELPAAPPHNHG